MYMKLKLTQVNQNQRELDWEVLKVRYQLSSATNSLTGFCAPLAVTVAWLTSGYWVEEWLPQMMTFFTSLTWTLSLSEIWPKALLWSSLVRQVMFFSGIEGANSFKMRAFVFAGLATTSTCINNSDYQFWVAFFIR